MLKDLSKRSEESELMDDFHDGIDQLRILFDDINRVNRILGGNHITINAIAKLIKDHPQPSYTIIDMGCGDGNMLREIAEYCRKKHIKVNLIGVELNEETLQLAEEASRNYGEISYMHQDILTLEPSTLQCDILINTLTMHHFNDEDIIVFLRKFIELASLAVVTNDLHRSLWAYYLYKLFSIIFIKTHTAKVDGLISISRAFVKSDFVGYSKHFPLVNHYIKWKWAFRYLWVIQLKQENVI